MTAPLLAADGRLVSVALDHGVFGSAGIVAGLGSLARRVAETVQARPDAIQLNLGSAERLQSALAGSPVRLVTRLDVTNAYQAGPGVGLYSLAVGRAVERAAAIGAAAIVVNLLDSDSDPDLRRDCLRIVNCLRAEASATGMTLMVEPLVLSDEGAIRYAVNGDVARIAPLVRQASELGADIIKADPTDQLEEFRTVVEAAGVPVLARGGGRVDDAELLDRTAALLAAGASGVVYGRNVFQHPEPAAITGRLMDVVHSRA
ncbi:MAG: class I fructose-bisphosphate aldolase [Ilumatobacteraceae bacterium]